MKLWSNVPRETKIIGKPKKCISFSWCKLVSFPYPQQVAHGFYSSMEPSLQQISFSCRSVVNFTVCLLIIKLTNVVHIMHMFLYKYHPTLFPSILSSHMRNSKGKRKLFGAMIIRNRTYNTKKEVIAFAPSFLWRIRNQTPMDPRKESEWQFRQYKKRHCYL